MEIIRAAQNYKVKVIVLEKRTAGSVREAWVGDIAPTEDGEQFIEAA